MMSDNLLSSNLTTPIPSFRLKASAPVSSAFHAIGIDTFIEAMEWTHHLPYSRNSYREKYRLIFDELRGTCSTKHAALAALCSENGIQAELKVIICKLNRALEPKASPLLDQLGVDFLPEAHCYLHYEGLDIDITFPDQSPFLRAEALQVHTIQPDQIGNHKLTLHQEYLRNWLRDQHLNNKLTLEMVWRLREAWIKELES